MSGDFFSEGNKNIGKLGRPDGHEYLELPDETKKNASKSRWNVPVVVFLRLNNMGNITMFVLLKTRNASNLLSLSI